MTYSDDRINHLSHLIIRTLGQKNPFEDETKALLTVKRAIREFGDILEVCDTAARQKIATLKRNVPEGSREWDVLYRQYLEAELRTKGI